ncbi:DUF4241 domain-containing protein [Glycomyces artemisiae]|uniref:Uncharacterized protein DUF4241 n=1 Tax=Glycomyces artemisiae TaxID=1076443 RepID=A0A2T0UG15_9ACTN|nr:DUF4241 domain-containing protein [Glycomyces artemisiae]PRY56814.1 uncharacterized protein DUF4241 [Glycomyces artemisiae]
MAYAPDFAVLLTPGAVFDAGWNDGTTGGIVPMEIGSAVLPTGRIVGCDPLVFPENAPYLVAVEPGSYPLIAWVAVFSREGKETDRRNAALELRVSGAPTVVWEMALTSADADVAGLSEDGFFGYGVDAGCGALADEAAVRPLKDWDFERTEDELIGEMDWEGPVTGLAAAVTDPATGANVVLVGSGFGDGAYPTFIGRDADGAVTRFVTDFLVLPD